MFSSQFSMGEEWLSLDDLLNSEINTASKKSELLREVPASVVIITKDEIQSLGFKSYTEILNHITGFYMIDDAHYLGHKNFGVRGFFSAGGFTNVVILVNGVNQLSDEYMEYPDTKITVPVASIDRIEVIRGPMSVIYGNGAFFGAINIITNEDSRNVVSAEIGNYGHKDVSAKISGEENTLKYFVNLGYSENSGIDVPFTSLTSDTALISYAGLEQGAATKDLLKTNNKYFGLHINYDDFYTDFSYNETMRGILDGLPSIGRGSQISHYATNFALGYQNQITSKVNLKGQIAYFMHTHSLDYEVYYPNFYEIDIKKSRAFEADFNADISLFKNFNLLIGYYLRDVLELLQLADFPSNGLARGDGDIRVDDDDNIMYNSIYSQFKYRFAERFTLIAGLRAEHLSPYNLIYQRGVVTRDSLSGKTVIYDKIEPRENGVSITPRAALIYDINDYNIVKILFGKAIKQPSFIENFRQVIQDRPDLFTQDIYTYEMNYVSNIKDILTINFSVFYNNIDNLITTTNEYVPNQGWNVFSANSGAFETYGIELGAEILLFDIFKANLSGLYQKTEYKKEGYEDIIPGYSPEIMLYGNIIYPVADFLTLSLIGKYTGEMQTEWVTETIPSEGSRIGSKIDPYFVLNFNVNYNCLMIDDLNINLNISNLTDTEIRYPATTTNAWFDKGFLGFGRQFSVRLQYEF